MEIVNTIETKIYKVREIALCLDSDLAKLYDVETKRINEAVKNNPEKFPCDFIFELTQEETKILKSKISTSSWSRRKKSLKVFTEQGVYMLATILKSKVATDVNYKYHANIYQKCENLLSTTKNIAKRIEEIEKTIKIDQQHQNIITYRIDEAF